jgi:hypothetical protein
MARFVTVLLQLLDANAPKNHLFSGLLLWGKGHKLQMSEMQ